MRFKSLVCGCLMVFSVGMIQGQVIDFENVPGVGVPTEGLAINTQYQSTVGVVFSLEGGGSPVIAEVGDPVTAFYGPPSSTTSDTPAAGQNVGSFFLTDDGLIAAASSALIVTYDNPTAAASGVILDIDGSESFLIEARDATTAVLQSISISAGDPGTGDGLATPWSFDLGSNVVASIRIQGSAPGAFGLAFDNFNARSAGGPQAIPTLSEWGLILLTSLLVFFGAWMLRGAARTNATT